MCLKNISESKPQNYKIKKIKITKNYKLQKLQISKIRNYIILKSEKITNYKKITKKLKNAGATAFLIFFGNIGLTLVQ